VRSRIFTITAGLVVAALGVAGCTSGRGAAGRSAAPDDGRPAGSAQQPGVDPEGGAPASTSAPSPPPGRKPPSRAEITSWVYQLQGYDKDGLGALARSPHRLAVIDLARDAKSAYFRPDEIAALHASGKRVLAYFEIGSIEEFRPEYGPVRQGAGDLVLNRWADWPNEHFVRYWDPRWWDRVVRPRIDQALKAGFDGVYLDTPLAYEELDLGLTPGQSRESLGRAMVDLIVRISRYAKAQRPDFWIFPQNSPELRRYSGYTEAIDGIGMEELFFRATDQACTQDFCAENLANARALRDAGKLVLAVDYAQNGTNVRTACGRYRTERIAGYVTVRDLDRIAAPCG
jgi:cysteinyl-tRNA synthetase